jgi:small multidrug resistance family-3 protein
VLSSPGASLLFLGLAAFAEIAGCFSFWAWIRLGRSPLWILPGVASLVLFAWALTQVQAPFAGRTYAAYGGIYIAASLVWLRAVEGVAPDRWDAIGGMVAIAGAMIVLLGPR